MTKEVSFHYGIKWIADSVDRPQEILEWDYKNKRSESDLKVAEILHAEFPQVSKELLKGEARDVRVVKGDTLVLATAPRVYEQWKYDYLKSDICITGPKEKEDEIVKEFEDQKKAAIRAKKKGLIYVEHIKPTLDRLVQDGLIKGVLGRGSYFDNRGFPVKNDDIDFILLVERPHQEDTDKIIETLKRIPRFSVAMVMGKDMVVKKGERPEFSFIIVSDDMATHSKGNNYEKYVLENSVGIDLQHLPSEKSKNIARRFINLLPKQDARSDIPRLPPINPEELYNYYIKEVRLPNHGYKSREESERRTPKEDTTLFKSGKKQLIFVAGDHMHGDNHYTEFLDKLLEKEKPQIILVEDIRNSDPKQRLENTRKKSRSRWTEVDWLYNWGEEHNVPVRGMDIISGNQLNPFLEIGGTEGVKVAILVSVIYDYRNPYVADPTKKFSNQEYYDLAIDSARKRWLESDLWKPFRDVFLKLKNSSEYKDMTYDAFIRAVVSEEMKKYVDKGDVPNLLENNDLKAPYPFSNRYKLNKIWTRSNAARDSVMIEECNKAILRVDRVVAVAGSGHIQCLRKPLTKTLEQEFGSIDVSVGVDI